jgi:hypothetical protein
VMISRYHTFNITAVSYWLSALNVVDQYSY